MYRVNVGGTDYFAPDLATLQQWASQGRVLPETMVWVESLQRSVRAAEVPDLQFAGGGYAQPTGSASNQQPYAQPTTYEKVPNNLILAIISTLCCCMPLGIASIIFAAQVDGLAARGEIAKAQDSANKAKTFAIIGIVVGFFTQGIWFAITIAAEFM
jgi:hypothetical protein